MEFGEMIRNTSNWSNFCMLLRRAGLSASAGHSCLACAEMTSVFWQTRSCQYGEVETTFHIWQSLNKNVDTYHEKAKFPETRSKSQHTRMSPRTYNLSRNNGLALVPGTIFCNICWHVGYLMPGIFYPRVLEHIAPKLQWLFPYFQCQTFQWCHFWYRVMSISDRNPIWQSPNEMYRYMAQER